MEPATGGMAPEHWISLGALLVAGISVIASAWLGPRMAARLERAGRIRDERAAVYADTLRLFRARISGLSRRSVFGLPEEEDQEPKGVAATTIEARLLLCASEPVWESYEAFMAGFISTFRDVMKVHAAKGRGEDDVAARLAIGRVHDHLLGVVDEATDRMRADLGTERMLVTFRARTRPGPGRLPDEPTTP